MRKYNGSDIFGASFLHDDEITDFILTDSSMSFTCSDVHLPIENGYVGKSILVKIENWSDLKILRFDSNTDVTEEITISESSSILTICECEISESKITFEGFETSQNLWQSYIFIDPSISITAGMALSFQDSSHWAI